MKALFNLVDGAFALICKMILGILWRLTDESNANIAQATVVALPTIGAIVTAVHFIRAPSVSAAALVPFAILMSAPVVILLCVYVKAIDEAVVKNGNIEFRLRIVVCSIMLLTIALALVSGFLPFVFIGIAFYFATDHRPSRHATQTGV